MKTLTNFPYQHVLVLGLAKSGTAAANLLLNSNIKVRVNDANVDPEDPVVKDLEKKGATVITGSHPISVLENIDLIVKNPGIPYSNVILEEAIRRNIPIITEIELAARLAQNNELIGVTGSNGKTTTTTLIYEILKASDQPVKLAGNIGIVATDVAQTLEEKDKLLVELSSFQLMGVQTFRPNIAALLNLYEAHIDYHGSVENYVRAKMNVFMQQTEEDFLVYNADDPKVKEVVQHCKATLVPFSTKETLSNGAMIDNGTIYFKGEEIISLKNVVLVGEHNYENILAAIAVALLSGATKEGIRKVLTTFSGVKHRLQYVTTINGRLFYNDSKATNILATQKALKSFEQPVILLAGGLDRGDEYDSLLPFVKHVKAMVLFGETAKKLAAFAKKAKIEEVRIVKDVQEAAKVAYDLSKEGDVILLSPACASWDQYKTFEERGDMFIQAVHILA